MKKSFIAIAAITISVFIAGCSTTATLNTVQTSNTFTNKLPLKAAIYVPSDLTNREVMVSPSTITCSAWKAKINSGNGYQTAIVSGLSAAMESLVRVTTVPTPEMAKANGYDLLVTVNLSNENSSVTVNESFLTNTINSQFQVSFTLSFSDRNGQSLYSYTANGSGFNTVSGTCSDIAESTKKSMETALKQVADYISQSTYGSVQLSEYAKKSKQM